MSREDLYPTRIAEEKIIERSDPVVYGQEAWGAYSLDAASLAQYERDGFILLESLFSLEEIALFEQAFVEVGAEAAAAGSDKVIVEPDSKVVRSVFAQHELSDLLARLAVDERLLDVACQILASEVYLHQARINLKTAVYGQSFSWHSDFETWHSEDGLPRLRVLTAMIFLTDNNQFNGPLYVVPGSHYWFVSCQGETPADNYKSSLRQQVIGSPLPHSLEALVAASQQKLEAVTGPAGSVLFFDGNLMHASPDNLSPWPRTNLFWVYNSMENQAAEPYIERPPRPSFLASRDFTPLKPIKNQFIKEK
ncbi:MAG TPA: phytanoyl-CoA dioxygenase family protein [Anaerolineae bacterium]|nr:phytanoyl-CoA dioxygenase family protein [Anaerolineae bacterium]